SSRRRHTRSKRDWSSDVCSSDLEAVAQIIIVSIPCMQVQGSMAAIVIPIPTSGGSDRFIGSKFLHTPSISLLIRTIERFVSTDQKFTRADFVSFFQAASEFFFQI